MKRNLPVTGQEKSYSDHIKIISTTTPKGVIDSINEDFVHTSGFSEEELLGKSHNVVRHPDMPPVAFEDLWNTIKAGKPWMGLVKNRCKNGDHYWVDAFVTPVYQDGKLAGYQSVRIKPSRASVFRAERLYGRLNAGKRLTGRLANLGVVPRLAMAFGLLMAIVTGVMGWLGGLAVETSAGSALLAAALCYPLAAFMGRPWVRAAAMAREVFDNPIAQRVYAGGNDETAQVHTALLAQKAMLRTVLVRLNDANNGLRSVAKRTVAIAKQNGQGVGRQQEVMDEVATAIERMAETLQGIAREAVEMAEGTRASEEQAKQGQQVMRGAVEGIDALAEAVGRSATVIHEVRGYSEQIGSVVDVIRGISEQTNLLALNAAIEAARAGEQGRGFAVVADEVRTLASRTQSSTAEIQIMIERLQGGIEKAVAAMDEGRSKVDDGVERAAAAGQALSSIAEAVNGISDMNSRIAKAASEQGDIASDVNRSIGRVNQVAQQNAAGALETTAYSDQLDQAVDRLGMLIKQFEQR